MTATALLLAAALAQGSAANPCDTPARAQASKVGDTTVHDVLALRDMGPSWAWTGSPSPFSVSPDRRAVAVQLTRADAETDDYCHTLAIVDIRTGASRIIDRWRGFLRQAYDHNGNLANFENGVARPLRPRWSPDGRALIYMKPVGGSAQLWRVAAEDGAPVQLTTTDETLDAVWSSPSRIIAGNAAPLTKARAEIRAEGRSGYLYDERFFPLRSAEPFPRAPIAPHLIAIDADTGTSVPASADEARLYEAAPRPTMAGQPRTDGPLSAALRDEGGRTVLTASLDGARQECSSALCADIVELAPRTAHRDVIFLRREGWAKAGAGLYRWDLRNGGVRRLAHDSGLLFGCDPGPIEWVCARESATEPRHLVQIDLRTGRVRNLFDPNPDFPRTARGRVKRIEVRTSAGTEAYADMVLPKDFVPGRRYPVVIVQYESRGFLRGGTGDEYPIFALADRGYLVLSVHRPADFASLSKPAPRDLREHNRLNVQGWADRRHALSALMATLDHPDVATKVDPKRVGITGLSDGVGTVLFGLLGTDRFAAAIISSCCEEPVNAMTLMGPTFAEILRYSGYPSLIRPSRDFWAPYSLRENAERVRTPLLMHMADREYLLGLESYAALKEAGAPTELYVFPDEYHVKWRPAHRLAIYERNLRWLDFWLRGVEGADARHAAERERWRAMRR